MESNLVGAMVSNEGGGGEGYENKAYSHDNSSHDSGFTSSGSPNKDKGRDDLSGAVVLQPGDLQTDGISRQDLVSQSGDADDDDLPCKWGPLKSACCSVLRSPKVVLFFLCCAACVQGMVVNGFVSVIISNVEKRFDLRSSDTGLIASSYDIASTLCLIPVTYFGGMGSKPRWLGFGIVLMGLGSFVFAIPHYTTCLYAYDNSGQDYCSISQGNESSTTTDMGAEGDGCQDISSLANYKYILILGQLLHGAGAAPLYTLGVTFLDENVKQQWSSVYVGIFYMMSIVGPAIGYLLGGYFLTYYTDFDEINTAILTITADSVGWVGAWWLGFLLGGVLAVIIGVILLGFPKELPGSAKHRSERVSEAHGGEKGVTHKKSGFGSLKDFPKSLKLLLTNPTFIFLNLGGATEAFVVAGFTTFIPKYLEFQYGVSASLAALIVGGCTVPAGGGGTFVGGYLVKRLKLRVAGTVKMCIVTCLCATVLSLIVLAKCPDITFAGINHGYNASQGEIEDPNVDNLYSTCNANCACEFEYFSPVCGDNNVMYFTSCAAGCTNVTEEDGYKVYTDCSCIDFNPVPDVNSELSISATEGRCQPDCNLLGVFMAFFTVVIFFTFCTIMPGLSATLRCVPDNQRSFALGIQWIFIRCLGSIPGPILFGHVIDSTCQFWLRPEEGSDEGACYFYSNTNLSNYLLAITMGFKALSIFFYVLSLALYKAPPGGEDEAKNEANAPYTVDSGEIHGKGMAGIDQREEGGQASSPHDKTGNGMGLSPITGSGDTVKQGVSDLGADGYYTANGSKY